MNFPYKGYMKAMVILNLYGIPFHAVMVFRPELDFLFKSASTYCGNETNTQKPTLSKYIDLGFFKVNQKMAFSG